MKLRSIRLSNLNAVILIMVFILIACEQKEDIKDNSMIEKEFNAFADSLESVLDPAYKEMALTYYNASISGTEKDYAKSAEAEMKLNKILSDRNAYARLKKFKDSRAITDSVPSRLLHVLYNDYLSKQIDTNKLNEMTKLQNAIEKKYSKYRATVGDKQYTDNEVEEILKTDTDSKNLKAVWLAHKKIGPVVADDILELIRLRNEVAVQLGFKNFHDMSLRLSDQDPDELEKFFDELDDLTRDGFVNLKREIDTHLAKLYNISADKLMPWHYQNRYFQEAPQIYELKLDDYYEDKNLEDLTKVYYNSIGMQIEDMLAKSDLYEKEGKNQHAYCIDIDRDSLDIRVLCNIIPNSSWMETMLHEFGHAVYQKYVDQSLPWSLKVPAHIFTTEGIAMLFGRFASNPVWMADMGLITAKEAESIAGDARKIARLQQLVFSRWVQVMYRFEKGMYADPDQDLNKLWWDLVEKYQMLKRPEGRDMPDWATKIHIATAPCYYHNYLLGEIFASQFYAYINKNIIGSKDGRQSSFFGNKDVGKFLIDKVFKTADRYYWNDMIEKATGEKLTPKYYAKQFVK